MRHFVKDALDKTTADRLPQSSLLGYACVSTHGQELTKQRAELQQAGCPRIFAEQITGVQRDRPELERSLDYLQVGDVVVVTRIGRLVRSSRDLLDIAKRLRLIDARLRSLRRAMGRYDNTSKVVGPYRDWDHL